MARAQLLTRTAATAAYSLIVNGQPVIRLHPQLAAVLAGRLGRQHASLLATPMTVEDGSIEWTTSLPGEVRAVSGLPESDRIALVKRAERMMAEIRGLSAGLREEGPTSLPVAEMVACAVRMPAGDWMYSVGGQPVMVMWGHGASPEAISVVAPAAAEAIPIARGTSAPLDSKSSSPSALSGSELASPPSRHRAGNDGLDTGQPDSTTESSHPRSSRRKWLGLLLLTSVAALATLVLVRCTGAPSLDLDKGISQAIEDNRALEEAIAAKRGQLNQFECVPDPQAPEPLASAPEVTPDDVVPTPAPSTSAPARAPQSSAPGAAPSPPKSSPKPVPKPLAPSSSASAPNQATAPPPESPEPPSAKATPPRDTTTCESRGPGDSPEVVMIVDASGSMREPFGGAPSRLEAAKQASAQMIRSLPPAVDVGLVDFVACNQVRRDRFYSAAERATLIGEVGRLTPQQGTPLAQAISRAGTVASRVSDSVLVVVSDGDDSCGGDPCAAARAAKSANPHLTINVIDLSTSARDRQVLQCVASAGGGKVLRPGDTLDLNQKMKEAAGPANCP